MAMLRPSASGHERKFGDKIAPPYSGPQPCRNYTRITRSGPIGKQLASCGRYVTSDIFSNAEPLYLHFQSSQILKPSCR